jgi:hypothetical protein
VGDAGGDDGEDVRGALATDVAPREQPVLSPEDQLAQLAFDTAVCQEDVAIVEEPT